MLIVCRKGKDKSKQGATTERNRKSKQEGAVKEMKEREKAKRRWSREKESNQGATTEIGKANKKVPRKGNEISIGESGKTDNIIW
ncbi:hypothetical protein CEXT_137981 [Caerostris extrusa]|uniref:Uncharacterized protein n=1 Tax=Caerostris extrusa TaxID=172846 RepID=A0AAV4XKW5_CAEEX|nr:hypothetical protein CEXT_137981 [Caerostris extrusa]